MIDAMNAALFAMFLSTPLGVGWTLPKGRRARRQQRERHRHAPAAKRAFASAVDTIRPTGAVGPTRKEIWLAGHDRRLSLGRGRNVPKSALQAQGRTRAIERRSPHVPPRHLDGRARLACGHAYDCGIATYSLCCGRFRRPARTRPGHIWR